jgi:two-component system cell cycle sensor histidine kinase/response regulator CckA
MSRLPKILIVEDDPRMCHTLGVLLGSEGYAIQTRHNGREALEALDKDDFDLVLLDFVLPDINGSEILNYITGQTSSTPVIVITGHISLDFAVESWKKGACDYIKKPFEPEELLKAVKNTLEREALRSERKRMEEALRESEQRYRNVYETAPLAFVIWDRECGVTGWNEQASKMFGWSRDEVLGKNFFGFLIPESARPHVENVVEKLLRGEIEPHAINENLTKNGEIILCRWSNSILRDSEGHIIGGMSLALDITEQYKAQEALQQSEKKHRTFLEASPDPVVAYDEEGHVIYLNPAFTQTFGWTLKELLGKRIDYVPEENRPETEAVIHKALAGGSVSGIRTRRYTKKGDIVEVSISIATYLGMDGKPAGSIHILRDTTKRRQIEAQLQQAQKLESIGTLAGGIAHDFNNLLMAVQGNVSLMLMESDNTHPYYERLKRIESQVRSGAQLTSCLLGYARKGKYQVRPLCLNQLVEDASETFGRTRKDITIHRELAKNLSPIEADRGQMEQVLLNLFVNAGDAMPGGGQLTLRTVNASHSDMKGRLYEPKRGKYVLLAVTDTGIGMDKEIRDRIFDPFFTTKEMGRGTGLGLASAYGIVKGHAGYIDVASKPGKGTTFSIYLPASEKTISQASSPYDPVVKGDEMVLLVDDEDAIRGVGRELLEAMGYKVLLAGDGREAVKLYKNKQDEIDIVLLDIVMPNMGGGETYDKLKEVNPDVKVLLFSGYTINGQAKEILERGCDGFIQKPFDAKELSSKLREILDKQ